MMNSWVKSVRFSNYFFCYCRNKPQGKRKLSDVHDVQHQVMLGELALQEKRSKKLDLQIKLLDKLLQTEPHAMTLSQFWTAMGAAQ